MITLLSGAPGAMRSPPLHPGSVAGTSTADENSGHESMGLLVASSNPMRRRSVESLSVRDRRRVVAADAAVDVKDAEAGIEREGGSRGRGREAILLREDRERDAGRGGLRERDGLESEERVLPPFVAIVALDEIRHVIRVARDGQVLTFATRRPRLVLRPDVGCRDPVILFHLPEEARLDLAVVESELLPHLRADRELPVVHGGGVDRLAVGELDPARLLVAVTPERDRGCVEPRRLRNLLGVEVGVQAGARELGGRILRSEARTRSDPSHASRS